MKDNLRKFVKRVFGGDLLNRTQMRLTLYNSGLLIVFLCLFAGIVYLLLYTVMAYQEKQTLQNLINQTVYYQKDVDTDTGNMREDSLMSGNEELFYYSIINSSGEELAGNSRIAPIQSEITDRIRGWIPSEGEIQSKEFSVPPPPERGEKHDKGSHFKNHNIDILFAGQPVYQGNQVKEIVYVGINQTSHQKLLHLFLWILLGLILFFFLVALWVSHQMANKAMIPVRHSFIRQREFVADASHELRTPLSVMHTSLEVLELEEEDHFSDYSQQVVKDMKDEVKRMTKLVGDLLTLARVDSGALNLNLTKFDIAPLAEQLIRTIQPVAATKNINVTSNILPELHVVGDIEKLRQLFYILLDNAIKYTPLNGQVSLTLEVKDKHWLLRVIDTGLGIIPEDLEKIFNRFYRADKHRSRQLGGVGLGLSIAHWIVSAHEGAISVESEIGQGSEFIVRIPLSQQTVATI
ncbi:sensor histidine kinase [Neobacillus terrae]|uniref:sensor histidine kinase n=1 Tax=Neobacillus terrae TaxID=3034837 RepID=UPI0014081EE4|nr:HAMP domain-containing sensor histidine kinase [Neobacillus terrae]NHM31902.1 HAMP domain-containing histidine kinase [Neobacillus terrae]